MRKEYVMNNTPTEPKDLSDAIQSSQALPLDFLGSTVTAVILLGLWYMLKNTMNFPDLVLLIRSVILGAVVHLLTIIVAENCTPNRMLQFPIDFVRSYTRSLIIRASLLQGVVYPLEQPSIGTKT